MQIQNNFLFDLNQYKYSNEIGEGRYGKVYQIQNKADNKIIYAAKTFLKEICLHSEQIKFVNEVDILSKTKNPALLSLVGYSFFDINNDQKPTIITEYYPYVLSNFLGKDSIPISKKYIILLGIVEGMLFLHSKGIVHRDLKPDNILLDENYYPHIGDFGQSKISNIDLNDFLMSTVVGTDYYMAPEILEGSYNSKVDIYSFAMIAYELITETMLSNSVKFKIIKRNIYPDLTIIENDQIKELINMCWSKNPDNRPTFSQILDTLKEKSVREYFQADENNDDEIINYLSKFNHTLQINGFSITQEIKKNADLGKIDSIVQYASILKAGKLLPQDLNEACRYFKIAADQNHVNSMFEYANILYNSENSENNKDVICEYFRKAINGGSADAMYTFGVILYQGMKGFKKDRNESLKMLEMAANLGNYEALKYYLKIIYEKDFRIVIKNDEKIVEFYRICSYKGNVEAIETYASILEERGVADAVQCYKLAADKGSATAMNKYASLVKSLNIQEATCYYLKAIEAENADAMYNYAKLLNSDENREGNKELIAKYFKMASDAGDPRAMLEYSYLLAKGRGVAIDQTESAKLLKASSEEGYALGMRRYASKMQETNRKESINLFKMAALKGDILSLRMFANLIKDADKLDALFCYRMCADLGDIPSMLMYARMKYNGECFQPDKTDASYLFKRAADCGNSEAMCIYAEMCYQGDGIEVNYNESLKYFVLATDAKETKGYAGYARALYEGKGNDVNKKLAAFYYQIAADNDDVQSMLKYAHMLFNGDGIPVDKTNASLYFKKAADCGNSEGMLMYAQMCFFGDGIDKNPLEAEQYFKNAADKKDDVKSILMYAEMKFHSVCKEIAVNQEEAALYYQMAADLKENPDAAFFFALINYYGCKNVPVNKEVAAKYFEIAGDLGHLGALRHYGSMLLNGDGIDKNNKLGTHYAYLCAQKQCGEDDYPKFLMAEFQLISKKIYGKLNLPKELEFFK